MIRRIDLFLHHESKYGVVDAFIYPFAEAFERAGIKCRILQTDPKQLGPFVKKLLEDPPDCTLCFNGLFPDNDNGQFLCDSLEIPHVACTLDSASYFAPLAKSENTIITCVDQFACEFMQGLGAKHVLFMPHAVDRNLISGPDEERCYDVTFFSSGYDYQAYQDGWRELYPASLAEVMDMAAEKALSPTDQCYIQTLVEAIDQKVREGRLDPATIDFNEALLALEFYTRGKDRVELIKAIHETPVHIFGSYREKETSWDALIGEKRSNLIIHDPLSYNEVLEVMKKSKIVLNSCLWIKRGAHERIFSALACGAAVMTMENPYLRNQFVEGESLLYYTPSRWDQVEATLQQYLEDEPARSTLAAKGRKIVMSGHTWDHRAKDLIEYLNRMLITMHPQTKI